MSQVNISLLFKKMMRWRYTLFIVLSITTSIFLWYYVITFCAVYETSSTGWIQGAMIGLVIDWFGISLLLPLIKTSLRLSVRNYPFLYFLVYIEYLFFLTECIG